MSWTFLDTWIAVAGVLCAASCALLGNYLVLRKMSMMGDAISHAVLPGIAAAFLLTGSRGSMTMLIGAAIVGVLTALFVQWISRFGQVDQGASMGVVFTALFAAGLLMIVRAADHVDLDPGCVLFGAIELVPLDTLRIAGFEIPRAVVVLGSVLAFNACFVLLFYKELKITSFDEELSGALGFRPAWMHYLLMTLVAITVVASFEAVGSILVIAMLVVPPATAFLLTGRLGRMLWLSVGIAVVAAVLGHVAAITVPPLAGYPDTSTAGMMAVVAGLIFMVVLFTAPERGIISRQRNRAALARRILQEDILGMLFRHAESSSEKPEANLSFLEATVPAASSRQRSRALSFLVRQGEVAGEGGGYVLTSKGAARARQLIRSHRLWESYLAKNLQIPMDHVHAPAEKLEHVTDEALARRLDVRLDSPEKDPQGRPIPPID